MAVRRPRQENPLDPPNDSPSEQHETQIPTDQGQTYVGAQDVRTGGYSEVQPPGFEGAFQAEVDPLELAQHRNRELLEHRIAYFAARMDEIQARLEELETEWDLDHALMATTASVSVTGVVMSILGGQKWLLLSLAAAGFAAQHAMTGWSPLATMLYRMGLRPTEEIEDERVALKALRGDFKELPGGGDCVARAQETIKAVDKDGSGI